MVFWHKNPRAMRRLRYIGNTSGMVESMKDLPEKVTYGKEKLPCLGRQG